MLVGGLGSNRSRPAWRQVDRALQHRTVLNRCNNRNAISRFPSQIQDFAKQFIYMQKKRHRSDYDPDAASDPNLTFSKSGVLRDMLDTEDVIRRFQKTPARDRRAFAGYVLLDIRND
jgi:hypothetical protein